MKHYVKIILIIGALIVLGFYMKKHRDEAMYPLKVTLYNYTDKGISIYLDDMFIGGVNPYVGGGSISCCVSIPAKWKPNTNVLARWDETTAGNTNVSNYQQIIPLEPYTDEDRGELQVHILPGQKIKLIVTKYDWEQPEHPMHAVYQGIQDEEKEYRKKEAIEYQKWYESLPKESEINQGE